tara:strand:- start:145 stop:570 length:426 start_codon:yes stop_codon:yes gene_type:complete
VSLIYHPVQKTDVSKSSPLDHRIAEVNVEWIGLNALDLIAELVQMEGKEAYVAADIESAAGSIRAEFLADGFPALVEKPFQPAVRPSAGIERLITAGTEAVNEVIKAARKRDKERHYPRQSLAEIPERTAVDASRQGQLAL